MAAGTLGVVTARLRLWEIEVPFRTPLRTAHGTLQARHSVIVALDSDGRTGWGEAPAFPSGRFGTAAHAFDDLADPSAWVGDLSPVQAPDLLHHHSVSAAELLSAYWSGYTWSLGWSSGRVGALGGILASTS